MKLLVGNTGLIGKTLRDFNYFDYEFNSKNLNQLLDLNTDDTTVDVYLACLPATKWLVNQNPSADVDNILNILEVLSKKKYNNIILYSTIDVYNNSPLLSNETHQPDFNSFNYGTNRLLFEKLIQNTLRYDKLVILRLPALFGKHIKKNILFDLLNDNNIRDINYNSTFQWYNLNNLAMDTENILTSSYQKNSIYNLFTEPIATSLILKFFNKTFDDVSTNGQDIIYNYTTKFSPTGYISDKFTILNEMESFILNYVNKD